MPIQIIDSETGFDRKNVEVARKELLKQLKCVPSLDVLNTNQQQLMKRVVHDIEKDTNKMYLSISSDENGMVSYTKEEENKLVIKRRVNTSLVKYLRKRMNVTENDIPDHILSTIQKVVMGKFKSQGQIKLLTGEDITQAYKNEIGGHSCMTGIVSKYTRLYELNPDKVSLLVYTSEDGIMYRALYWLTDCGTKYLDRIYPNDRVSDIIGAWIKSQNAFSYYNIPDVAKNWKVSLKHNNVFPFMDSFKFATDESNNNKIVLQIFDNNACYKSVSTSGLLTIHKKKECECGDWASMGNFEIGFMCSNCFHKKYIICERCGVMVHSDNAIYNGQFLCSECGVKNDSKED